MPAGLLSKINGTNLPASNSHNNLIAAAAARKAVIEAERALGYDPVDRENDKLGYDIESRDPNTGKLRFIEVKGRAIGANTVTVTKNEILTSLNKPDDFILAIVQLDMTSEPAVKYVRQPFKREPDFGVTSVNYNLHELLAKGQDPS